MNLLQKIDREECERLAQDFPVQNFRAGDTIVATIPRLKVSTSIKKGQKVEPSWYDEKIEGVCLSRTSRGMGSNVVIRRVVNGMGSILMVPLYGTKIEVLRRGIVRRSKLYYFAKLRGKKAKIREAKKA